MADYTDWARVEREQKAEAAHQLFLHTVIALIKEEGFCRVCGCMIHQNFVTNHVGKCDMRTSPVYRQKHADAQAREAAQEEIRAARAKLAALEAKELR